MSSALRLCLVDMNNGVANQATRCFRRIAFAFGERVRAQNPGVEVVFKHVQPRNLGELPTHDEDIVLSSGGPGSPHDGWDEPWCTGYRAFLDWMVEQNRARGGAAPKMLVVCHSFEISVLHFAVAEMRQRDALKFGLMPAYMTERGEQTDFLAPFGYRLFCWEHRNWEAVGLDEAKLASLGGAVLAMETHATHDERKYKGDALLALRFAPGVDGTQFHPEADKPGVMNWIERPEHKVAVQDAYGEVLYDRMVKSLGNPKRLAKTFALLIPGWLTYRFNEMAPSRGWKPLPPPEQSDTEFDVAV
jgi:GMP synthase-like glutamine amidotransferase